MGIGGCSPFFFTSAITSVVMGEFRNKGMLNNAASSIEFRKALAKMKENEEDMQFALDIAYNKKNIDAGREYQLEEAQKNYDNQQRLLEFNYFTQTSWPLNINVSTIWGINNDYSTCPMSVFLCKSNHGLLNRDYNNLCLEHNKNSKGLGNLVIYENAWNPEYKGGVAQGLNVHYIMQGLPTLLIMPYVIDGKIQLNACMWSFSSTGLASFNHSTLLSFDFNEDDYKKGLRDKINEAVFLATGVVRDAYMINEYQAPATLPMLIKDRFAAIPEDLQKFVIEEYSSMYQNTNKSLFRSMCANGQSIQSIQSSIMQLPINTNYQIEE